MIRLAPPLTTGAALSPAESYGLATLLDLSRLVLLDPGASGVQTTEEPEIVTLVVAGADRTDGMAALLDGSKAMDVRDGSVVVTRALLRAVTDVAGAAAEQRSPVRDRHSRVPSAENPLVAADHARDPIVSRCAAALRRDAMAAAGRRPVRTLAPWPNAARWAVALTHDLDVVALWPAFTVLRIAELTRKGKLGVAAQVAGAALGSAIAAPAAGTPVWRAARHVLDTERRAGVPATWFVIAGVPTLATMRAGDATYSAQSRAARRILRAITGNEGELGVHGSFATTESATAFAAERERLAAAMQAAMMRAPANGTGPVVPEIVGVRQHYLRMHPGGTQRAMVAAGFAYDTTYGFPDRNGFRLGVADVVTAWDDAAGREMALAEVPLIWMDRAQSKYQGIEDPARWIDDALELADISREVEGLWVGLWHPNLAPALGFPGAPAAYERLVLALMERTPYIARLGEIVAWRSLRRSIRARGIAPDGSVVLDGPAVRSFDVATEDGSGRAREALPRT